MQLKLTALPPADAIAAFRRRGGDRRATGGWQAWAAAEHARAFTVAQSVQADILNEVFGALDTAITQGQTLASFQAGLEPLLVQKGWWGKKSIVDAVTGEIKQVQLGSLHRLSTIFDTNMRVSYAVGRARRIARRAKVAPWLEYISVRDARTREQHRAWHGTILRVTDPWWQTHMPPNGWRCRCRVRQLTDAEMKRRGVKPSKTPRQAQRPWRNKITGEVQQVPVGIDPGWAQDVGALGLGAGAEAKLKASITALASQGAAGARAGVRILGQPETIKLGKSIRDQLIVTAKKMPPGDDFASTFRAATTALLRAQTGRAVPAKARPRRPSHPGDIAAARRVEQASALLPGTWVTRANQVPVKVEYNGQQAGGFYSAKNRLLNVSADPGNALHEYLHHCQQVLPGLDAHYVALHRKRTAGDPLETQLRGASGQFYLGDNAGRSDEYVDPYAGREYRPFDAQGHGRPMELITRAIQMLYFPVQGQELLGTLIEKDPEMLDLTLGLLFSYKPIP